MVRILQIYFFCVFYCAIAAAQSENKTLTLAFVGDVMMGTTYPSVQLPSNDGRQLFVAAAPFLKSAEVAIGNMEGTFCDGGETRKKVSKISYAFRTPTLYSERLKEAGFDYMCLSNNHINDFGQEGVASTCRQLGQWQIAYSGLMQLPHSVVLEREGKRIGICAFGYNPSTCRMQDTNLVRQVITDLVNTCDWVAVTFHGGAEGSAYSRVPKCKEMFCGEDRGDVMAFAHFCVDAGADVVVGHGPHVPRAMELYKHHLIAYSLGNFCTPYGINIAGVSGYAPLLHVKLDSDGRLLEGNIHSFVQQKGRGPQLDPQHRAAHEIKRLTALDFPKTPLRITGEGRLVQPN